jgi:hypothetical protein
MGHALDDRAEGSSNKRELEDGKQAGEGCCGQLRPAGEGELATVLRINPADDEAEGSFKDTE